MAPHDPFSDGTLRVPSGGARLFVRTAGPPAPEGPPPGAPALALLHAGVADHRMFDAQLAALAPALRVIAPDRRGHGRTEVRAGARDEPFSHAGDLLAVLDACGVDAAVLAGGSQGGRVALDFALAHPGRVRGLLLVAPVVSGMPEPDLPPDLRALDEEIDRAYEIEDLPRIAALELRAWLDGPREAPGRVAGPARALFEEMNRRVLEHPELTGARAPGDSWARLGEIGCPAAVICGTLDFPHMRRLAREVAEALPRAEHREIEGVAHMPGLERPEVLTEEIRRLLARL
jgi:pimeloyl-ACP methyl ester carboxylesterase